MRLLNSLLLEGVLLDTPVYSGATSADEPDWCTFTIGSEPEAPSVPVVTYGRPALRCSQILTKGSAIRVVGHIAQEAEATTGTFRLCVIAEHIEIKPVPTPRPTPEEVPNAF